MTITETQVGGRFDAQNSDFVGIADGIRVAIWQHWEMLTHDIVKHYRSDLFRDVEYLTSQLTTDMLKGIPDGGKSTLHVEADNCGTWISFTGATNNRQEVKGRYEISRENRLYGPTWAPYQVSIYRISFVQV